MNKYEVMYIIRPNLETEAIKEQIEAMKNLFAKFNANVLETKEIGLKDLAYEIERHKKGYYVWHLIEANKEAVAEYTRVAGINENIIRDGIYRK